MRKELFLLEFDKDRFIHSESEKGHTTIASQNIKQIVALSCASVAALVLRQATVSMSLRSSMKNRFCTLKAYKGTINKNEPFPLLALKKCALASAKSCAIFDSGLNSKQSVAKLKKFIRSSFLINEIFMFSYSRDALSKNFGRFCLRICQRRAFAPNLLEQIV